MRNTSVPVTNEFNISDAVRMRCWIVLCISCFAILLGLLVCYVYFWHSHYKTYLRSLYNNLVVSSIALQLLQAACRSVAAAALLTGSMKPWLCNVLGGADIALIYAVFVLFHGFYYAIMALSYHPLRRLALLCITREQYEAARTDLFSRWFYIFSFFLSVTMTVISFVWLGKAQWSPGQVSYFAVELGYCYLPLRGNLLHAETAAQRLFLLDILLPTASLVCLSVVSFLALRLRVTRAVSIRQLWPIYVRFFTIISYFSVLGGVQVAAYILDRESLSEVALVSSVTFPSTLVIHSLSFLVSERLLFSSLKSLVCGDTELESGSPLGEATRYRTFRGLSGFTSCIQSLLVLEVEGLQVVLPTTVSAEHDLLLSQAKHDNTRRSQHFHAGTRQSSTTPPPENKGTYREQC
jgi:hypothetical protein